MANPTGETSTPQAAYKSASFVVNLGTIASDTDLLGYALSNGNTTTACARRVRASVAGVIKVVHPNGVASTLTVAAGEVVDVLIRKILQSGTTATGIDVYF
jgi:hypothetical protein